jgi:hypothetical protein
MPSGEARQRKLVKDRERIRRKRADPNFRREEYNRKVAGFGGRAGFNKYYREPKGDLCFIGKSNGLTEPD